MDDAENIETRREDFEIHYDNDYQNRTNKEMLQLYMLENRRYLKTFLRISRVAILFLVSWYLVPNIYFLIPLVCYVLVIIVSGIILMAIFIEMKSFETKAIAWKAYVNKRVLRYGDYGVILSVQSGSKGMYREAYAWSRYKNIIEWNDLLMLTPAKKKAVPFVIWKDEIGNENFETFKKYASKKVVYELKENFSITL